MTAVVRKDHDELRELYRELILDHARNPRNFGVIERATHRAEGINPVCGDKLRLYLHVDADGSVDDIRFEGTGCAISLASASLLTESVVGMTVTEAESFLGVVTSELTGRGDSGPALGKLGALRGVREFPSRVKCATLAWRTLGNALARCRDIASTE